MKTPIILFFIFFHALNINSQVTIEYGEKFKNEKREIPVSIIDRDETGYYFLYSEGKYGQGDDIYLRKFNLDLTPTNLRAKLKIEVEGSKFNSLGISRIKNKLVHLFSLQSSAEKGYYYQFIDISDFTISQKELITRVNFYTGSKNKEYLRNFFIKNSQDEIVLFFRVMGEKSESLKFRKKVFDTDFKEKYEKVYEFGIENGKASYSDIFRSKADIFYLQTKVYDSNKIFADENKHRYQHQIYRLDSVSPVRLSNIRPKDVHMRFLDANVDDNEEMILTGITSKKDMYSMSGIYNAKINLNDGSFVYENYNKLSADFFSQLMIDGKRKEKLKKKYLEGKRENINYIFKKSYLLENGETILIAEQIWSMSANFATTYYHHNIAVIKLDKQGKIVWEKKIGKMNTKNNTPTYSSFLPILRDCKLLLLYNGTEDNLNHKTGVVKNSFGSLKSAFICTQVDLKTGEYKRNVISTKSELDGITIRPFLYNWIDKNTLLMFGQDISNLKNQRFFKLKFD